MTKAQRKANRKKTIEPSGPASQPKSASDPNAPAHGFNFTSKNPFGGEIPPGLHALQPVVGTRNPLDGRLLTADQIKALARLKRYRTAIERRMQRDIQRLLHLQELRKKRDALG